MLDSSWIDRQSQPLPFRSCYFNRSLRSIDELFQTWVQEQLQLNQLAPAMKIETNGDLKVLKNDEN